MEPDDRKVCPYDGEHGSRAVCRLCEDASGAGKRADKAPRGDHFPGDEMGGGVFGTVSEDRGKRKEDSHTGGYALGYINGNLPEGGAGNLFRPDSGSLL